MTAGVLEGLTVVEVAQNLAGPWCTRILAGLGASVIKVEPPSGDAARRWGPPFAHGVGPIFAAANPDKRSVTLDLTDPRGMDVLRRLARRADVLVEALRPGALAALGLDPERARAEHQGLIWVSIGAYGEEGPLAALPGYEPLMQAHGGLMSYTGEAGGPPVRVGTSIIDMGTGMWAALAVLAALRERDRTGHGSRVSAALFDTALTWSGYHLLAAATDGTVAGRHGSELPLICPYGAFPTADGRVMIAVGSDALFARLCRALDLPGLLDDGRFATNPLRVEHRSVVNGEVSSRTRAHTSDDLLARLRSAGVPCAPIRDVGELLADPQTRASGMLTEVDDEAGRVHALLGLPVRAEGQRPPTRRPAPELGAHTDEVLVELGFGPGEIEELRRDGVA